MAYSKSGASVLRQIPPNRLLTESNAPFAEATRCTPSLPGGAQGALDWIAQEKKLPPEQVRQLVADNPRVLEHQRVIPASIGARNAGM